MAMSVIGQRSDDEQAQGAPLSTTPPEQRTDGFVTELMRTAGGKDRGVLPGNGVLFAHLFGSPQILSEEATSSSAQLCFRQSRQTNVFTSSSDQDGTFRQSAQHGEIAIAGVDNDPQDALGEIGDAVQPRADLLNQESPLSTE